MRKPLYGKLTISAGLLALILMLIGPAWAGTWFGTHGTSGVVQDSAAILDKDVMGDGLKLTFKNSRSSWIHYAVPTTTYTWPVFMQFKTRYIRLKFNAMSTDIKVTNVSVYDGNIKKFELPLDFATGLTGFYDLILDMGSNLEFTRALGISLQVESGGAAMSHDVDIYAVGARYDE